MKDFFAALARLLKFVPTRLEKHRKEALVFLREASERRGRRQGPKGVSVVRLLLTLLIAAVLALWAQGCASLPPDVVALEQQNAWLREALDACEADGGRCLELLGECESLLGVE